MYFHEMRPHVMNQCMDNFFSHILSKFTKKYPYIIKQIYNFVLNVAPEFVSNFEEYFQVPLWNQHSALHETPGEQRSVPGPLDDPPGVLYHEAQQYHRDDGEHRLL